MAFGFEEQALLARTEEITPPSPTPASPQDMPMGKIGDLRISRLICGGNLISGFAHSRDLIYVSSLLKHYFTDEKIFETFQVCEANGINTAILRLDQDTLRIINMYWREHGGKLQWIAQIKPTEQDLFSETKQAVDMGALGVYIQGERGDSMIRTGHAGLIAKVIEHIKANGVIAGVGAHSIDVVVECEKAGVNPDFYMKTFNSKQYWSAGPKTKHDNIWEETPDKTAEVMAKTAKPWIGFKVLGAGAIEPQEGFRYAFRNGADFLCAGMFDFQVAEDATLARKAFADAQNRKRPWRA